MFVHYSRSPSSIPHRCGGITAPNQKTMELVTNTPILPPGWTIVQSGKGVVLASRTYIRGAKSSTDYVQLVDLAAGATIKLRQGNKAIATPALPSPAYPFQKLASASAPSWYWDTHKSAKSFTMTNLQFFNFKNGTLSFPLKDRGTIISCGSANQEPNAKRKLGIKGSTIIVADYKTTQNTYNMVAANLISPTVIVGLHPDTPKFPSALIGRTYLACQNTTLLIYATSRANQAQARSVLTSEFAINDANIIMMDGSGSTQLICRGTNYINSMDNRSIPSIIEVLEN